MEIKILIRTPDGQATKTERKLRPFLLGRTKKGHTVFVNKLDNKIVWVVNAPIHKIMNINKNIARFDIITRMIFDNKTFKKSLRSKLTEEDEKTLKNMLLNHTKITVIKQATTDETEKYTTTWYEKIKNKFKKI